MIWPFRRNRRPRPDDLMAVADAVQAAPRLDLAQADVDARFAELTAGWAPQPERRRPPISPGPSSFVEES